MENKTFKALVVRENEDNSFTRSIEEKHISDLVKKDVCIKVMYSSLNYKDALSATGNKGVTRNYPHTPGVDAAGIVVSSQSKLYKQGDEVIVTGYDLGMNTDGGFGEYIYVDESWVVPLPKGLSLKEAMIYGTAGFTAALSVYKLIKHGIKPDDGHILVTGATGGVGSVAVAILAKLGFHVIAATGKPEAKDTLINLGAKDIILRSELDDQTKRPLLKGKWAGVVDTVGGNMLASAIKETKYDGALTCCGLVQSPKLLTTVYPFILRGVTLYGIDSVECKNDLRLTVWNLLASTYKVNHLAYEEIKLEEISKKIDLILKGKLVGRTVIKI